ncbi:TetR family transcriptional regulator C-terminal domain-containing protein [Zobellia sp. B3R18]|uniref:TetR family transcriptional regulator C-terminal domain-containing protein n=1 Tax=Zobellia sp. B3R18 TaxID=2841568 RepID=UPI001C066854|nr:TetR family transcriptional regulator C-terminal domain-containing protein [Zobellia sp. B3R18]MBU2973618.1 TetR/AcrR family transcriptional regulator [Zobellia sp. B3R18]
MVAKSKASKVTEDSIISMYMDYVLEHESVPKSIYKFCKQNKLSEADFYRLFGSVESLQKEIWNKFYTNTEALILKNEAYNNFSNKDKMLTFFYTFFEMLTLNRSYVLFALKEHNSPLKNLGQLKGLRKHVKSFAAELINDANANKNLKITKYNPQVFSKGAWLQFLFLLKFWMDDTSPGFEKTDVAIEKSIHTVFDIFDNTPLENILDFGKFLYKETFA